MMSRFFIIALVACVVNAATWLNLNPEKPKEFADKEGCYIKEIKDVIPFGTEITPKGICIRVNCADGVVDYASCGIVSSGDPNCHKTDEDLSKPYPDCCPSVKCDMENNIS